MVVRKGTEGRRCRREGPGPPGCTGRTPGKRQRRRHGAARVAAELSRATSSSRTSALACLSRALDDREILLQKQSRVFFQISGAGHEILLLALARSLRPAYDWFFPYYRDRALVLALGVTPLDIMLQAVGSSLDPASGGRQMPCHWGAVTRNIVTQSSPTGQPVPAGRGVRRGGPLHRPATRPAGMHAPTATRSPTCRWARGPPPKASSGRASTPRAACTCPRSSSWPTTATPSRCASADQSPAPVAELVRGFRGLAVTQMDGWDYASCRTKGGRAIARVRAGEGPGLIHAHVTRPYSHSSADSQAKYRDAGELAEEQAHDPIDTLERQLVGAGVLTEDEAAGAARRGARPRRRRGRRGPRRAAARPGHRDRQRGAPAARCPRPSPTRPRRRPTAANRW